VNTVDELQIPPQVALFWLRQDRMEYVCGMRRLNQFEREMSIFPLNMMHLGSDPEDSVRFLRYLWKADDESDGGDDATYAARGLVAWCKEARNR
jgi:hypothetical protein